MAEPTRSASARRCRRHGRGHRRDRRCHCHRRGRRCHCHRRGRRCHCRCHRRNRQCHCRCHRRGRRCRLSLLLSLSLLSLSLLSLSLSLSFGCDSLRHHGFTSTEKPLLTYRTAVSRCWISVCHLRSANLRTRGSQHGSTVMRSTSMIVLPVCSHIDDTHVGIRSLCHLAISKCHLL